MRCVSPVRGLVFLCMTYLFLGAVFPAEAAVPVPRFRPAVLGSGPESLVNQIDFQDLFKKGQKDGAIMFCCRVATTGNDPNSPTLTGSPLVSSHIWYVVPAANAGSRS